MKTTYLFTSVLALVVALANAANGASLSFVPIGFQLDSDTIQDIGVKVGNSVDLSFLKE